LIGRCSRGNSAARRAAAQRRARCHTNRGSARTGGRVRARRLRGRRRAVGPTGMAAPATSQ
jgi:hypothetical protein